MLRQSYLQADRSIGAAASANDAAGAGPAPAHEEPPTDLDRLVTEWRAVARADGTSPRPTERRPGA